MSKERFLLSMLASIFVFQAGVFGYSVWWCGRNGGLQSCPELRQSYNDTFNLMVATTLGLLTGSAFTKPDA